MAFNNAIMNQPDQTFMENVVGMKKRFFTLGTLLTVILLTACGAGSEESGIEVHEALTGAAAQGEDSPVYLAMHNHGSETDQLTGAASDAAEAVQLNNGAEVVQVIPVYANTEFVFIPDGYHIMLVGLKQELHLGDEIEIVLHFRDHEDITIQVPVQETAEHGHEEP